MAASLRLNLAVDGLDLQPSTFAATFFSAIIKLSPSVIGYCHSTYNSYFFNKWSRVLVPATFAFVVSYGLTEYVVLRDPLDFASLLAQFVIKLAIAGMMTLLSHNLRQRLLDRQNGPRLFKVLHLIEKVDEDSNKSHFDFRRHLAARLLGDKAESQKPSSCR